MAWGRARHAQDKRARHRSIPILALVGGDAGQAIRLIEVRERQYRWASTDGVTLIVPEVKGSDETWWSGEGAPIQQVCFVEDVSEGGAWMAARLPRATTVFRPLYQSSPQPYPSVPASTSHGLSHINPNPVLTLSTSQTGGVPHADVTFNPWRQSQFAVVDQDGNWGIWECERRFSTNDRYHARSIAKGTMVDHAGNRSTNISARQADGWAIIRWVTNQNTIVVCNRREMVLCDVSSKTPKRLPVPDLGIPRTPHWILDLRRSPHNSSHLFIVTSTQIFWLDVSAAAETSQESTTFFGARILVSWHHFRDSEDLSLSLDVIPVDQGG